MCSVFENGVRDMTVKTTQKSCTMLVTMNRAASIVENMFMMWMKMMRFIPSARIVHKILSENESDRCFKFQTYKLKWM